MRQGALPPAGSIACAVLIRSPTSASTAAGRRATVHTSQSAGSGWDGWDGNAPPLRMTRLPWRPEAPRDTHAAHLYGMGRPCGGRQPQPGATLTWKTGAPVTASTMSSWIRAAGSFVESLDRAAGEQLARGAVEAVGALLPSSL